MNSKVQCIPWKVQNGEHELLEVSKDDGEEEMPFSVIEGQAEGSG